ncbi:MAG: MotA/TolQ/ExbB proton channel family protein, partial [Bacteriovorax sp.]|nr:MotA/TolQ/ExbB proton channel family protein [Bacteriovorax sp.]
INAIKIPFLKEGLELFLDGSLSKDEMVEVLEKRIEIQNGRYRREGNTFKVIGRFPPAFGLIGATLGMIGLLQGLGAPNAFEQLGPAMSVALTSTFWGLVLANVVLLPLGENLYLAAEEDLIIREMVLCGVLLLREKKHPLLVQENLNSYLPPRERLS